MEVYPGTCSWIVSWTRVSTGIIKYTVGNGTNF